MLNRTIVSRRFREDLLNAFPGLGGNVGHWRLLEAILFGTFRNPQGRRVLPFGEILEAYGDRSHRTRTGDLVERFSRDVAKVELSGWYHGWATVPNSARYVKGHGFPSWVVKSARRELVGSCDDPVFLDTGKAASAQRLHEARRELEREASCRADALLVGIDTIKEEIATPKTCAVQSVHALLYYMNCLPSGTFASLRHLVPEARKVAARYPACEEQQLRILKNIEFDPKPFYKPSARTLRIFALNPSFPRLHTDVREVLTEGWMKADLRAAQLAIVARLWEVESLLRRLEREDDVWDEIVVGSGMRDVPDARATVKRATYAITFGMSGQALGVFLDERLGLSRSHIKGIRAQPIFKELVRRREQVLRNLKKQGYGIDAFGRRIFPPVDKRGDNYRSVLAQIAQSHEHRLMMPILRLAEDNGGAHGFAITMWLHDGVCIQLKHQRDERLWRERLVKAIDEEARTSGFPTRLIIE